MLDVSTERQKRMGQIYYHGLNEKRENTRIKNKNKSKEIKKFHQRNVNKKI